MSKREAVPKHSLPPQKQILSYMGRFINCPYAPDTDGRGAFFVGETGDADYHGQRVRRSCNDTSQESVCNWAPEASAFMERKKSERFSLSDFLIPH